MIRNQKLFLFDCLDQVKRVRFKVMLGLMDRRGWNRDQGSLYKYGEQEFGVLISGWIT